MDDVIEMTDIGGHRVGDVMAGNRELRAALERGQPVGDAANEVIKHQQFGLIGIGLRFIEMQHRLNQVIAEKTGSTNDQNAFALQIGELLFQAGANVVQILGDNFLSSLGCVHETLIAKE